MYLDTHRHREIERERLAEETAGISRRGRSVGGSFRLRARVSRFLIGTAFVLDPEAGRREFWGRAAESDPAA